MSHPTDPGVNIYAMLEMLQQQARRVQDTTDKEALLTEIKRGKALSEISCQFTASARLIADHARATGTDVPLLTLDQPAITHPAPGRTVHRLMG